jgi:hypothetical protein
VLMVVQLATVQPYTMQYFQFDYTAQAYPPVDVDIGLYALNGSAQFFVANTRNPDGSLVKPTLACTTPGTPRKSAHVNFAGFVCWFRLLSRAVVVSCCFVSCCFVSCCFVSCCFVRIVS